MQNQMPPVITNQAAAHHAARMQMMQASIQVWRSRVIPPPLPALKAVVTELVKAPPTAEELNLLTEVATKAQEQDLTVEQIEALFGDTRLWAQLRALTKDDKRLELIGLILSAVMVLLMIYDILVKQQAAPPPAPAPTVTVNVTVSTDEIVKHVEERIEREHGQPSVGSSRTGEPASGADVH